MLVVTADQAKFVYAPQFFAAVYDKYGDGAIIAMIAHEYGHALDEVYPASWMKSGWSPGAAGRCMGRVCAGQKRSECERFERRL